MINAFAAEGALHAAEAASEIEIFDHLHFGIERRVFGQVAEVFADLLGFVEDVVAIDGGSSAGGRKVAGQHLEGGRFARAIGPEEADNFAAGDFKGDMVDGEDVAIGLGELLNGNHSEDLVM